MILTPDSESSGSPLILPSHRISFTKPIASVVLASSRNRIVYTDGSCETKTYLQQIVSCKYYTALIKIAYPKCKMNWCQSNSMSVFYCVVVNYKISLIHVVVWPRYYRVQVHSASACIRVTYQTGAMFFSPVSARCCILDWLCLRFSDFTYYIVFSCSSMNL